MSEHLHSETVPGCYRCELTDDEATFDTRLDPADYWSDQRYEDALCAELGEAEYLRRMGGKK